MFYGSPSWGGGLHRQGSHEAMSLCSAGTHHELESRSFHGALGRMKVFSVWLAAYFRATQQ
jgi:hypothetical protein